MSSIKDASGSSGLKKIGFLEDGTVVIARETSSPGRHYSGGPTLEIQHGKKQIKFRYLEKKD